MFNPFWAVYRNPLTTLLTVWCVCFPIYLVVCSKHLSVIIDYYTPVCGNSEYVLVWSNLFTRGRVEPSLVISSLFWKTMKKYELCKEIPRFPWAFYTAVSTVLISIGYVLQACVRNGPFRTLMGYLTTTHTLKDTKRMSSGVKCPRFTETTKANPHAGGASLRLQYHTWIHNICCGFSPIPTIPSIVRYDISLSSRDTIWGSQVIGRRRIVTPTDLTVDRPEEHPFVFGLPVSMVDTAHYLKTSEFDEFAGSPIISNCIVPQAVAWKTGWSTAFIDGDSMVTENVVGGETYKHHLLDPLQHKFVLYGRWKTYTYEQTVLHVPNSNQAIFIWTPIAVTSLWPPFYYILHILAFKRCPVRPGWWKGATKVAFRNKSGPDLTTIQVAIPKASGDVVSVREENTKNGECTELSRKTCDIVALRAALSGSPTNVYDASQVLSKNNEVSNPETNTMAALASQPGKLPDLSLPPNFQPGENVETVGLKTSIVSSDGSSTNFPARVCAVNDGALTAEAKRSAMLQANVPESIPLEYATAIDLAVQHICNKIGIIEPISMEMAEKFQTRPAQVKRIAEMHKSDSNPNPTPDPAPAQKNEAVQKPSPRTIYPANTQYGLALSCYTRPLYTALKGIEGWACGLNGEDTAKKVRAICLQGDVECADVSDADKSHGPLTRDRIYGEIMRCVSEGNPELKQLLQQSRSVKVKTKEFTFFTNGMNLSGLPDTTILNTLVTLTIALASQHLLGIPIDTATCGLFSGDDSIIPKKISETYVKLSAAHGLTMKIEALRDSSMVKFLNRIYFDPVATLTSFPSITRLVSKFNVYTTSDAGLAERIVGSRISDPFNPLLSAFVNAQYKRFPAENTLAIKACKKQPSKELTMKTEAGAFPFDKKFSNAVLEAMAWEINKPLSFLNDWIVKAKLVKDDKTWGEMPKLVDGVETVGKLPHTSICYPLKSEKKQTNKKPALSKKK